MLNCKLGNQNRVLGGEPEQRNQASVIKLIWKYKSLFSPRINKIDHAPNNANGIAIITTNGKRNISNCPAKTKQKLHHRYLVDNFYN